MVTMKAMSSKSSKSKVTLVLSQADSSVYPDVPFLSFLQNVCVWVCVCVCVCVCVSA